MQNLRTISAHLSQDGANDWPAIIAGLAEPRERSDWTSLAEQLTSKLRVPDCAARVRAAFDAAQDLAEQSRPADDCDDSEVWNAWNHHVDRATALWYLLGKPIHRGLRLHCGLYGGNNGIVLQFTPGTQPIRHLGGGIVSMGGGELDVLFDNHESRSLPECIATGVQWEFRAGRASEESIAALRAELEQHERDEKETQRAASEQRQKDLEIMREKYDSWLEPLGKDVKLSDYALGAKNIRTELKQAFPWVKFRVTSKGYSGGCSIDIHWEFGPTTKEVEAITDKYETHGFDGMTDSSYSRDSLHADRYGGAKHVMAHGRRFPEEFHEQVGRDLCALQHVPYNGRHTAGLLGEHCGQDLQSYVNELIYRTRFGPGEKYAGVEFTPDEVRHPARVQQAASDYDHADAHWCRIQKTIDPNDPMKRFNPITAAAKAEVTSQKAITPLPAPCSELSTLHAVAIKKSVHTKHGHDIWIARLADRVDKDEFTRVLDEAKRLGGYWSHFGPSDLHGFIFKAEAKAQEFRASVSGDQCVTAPATVAPSHRPPSAAPNVVPVNFQTGAPVAIAAATAPRPWRRLLQP